MIMIIRKYNDKTLYYNYCRKKPLHYILELFKWPKYKIKVRKDKTKCLLKHSGLRMKVKPYENRSQRLKIRADKQFPTKERVLQNHCKVYGNFKGQ